MGTDFEIILAPLDPYFKPSYAMFDSLCQFLLDKQIICERVNEHRQSSFFSFEKLELFPPNFKLPHPDDWTQETVDLYERLFCYDCTYLSETNQVIDHYMDPDEFRPQLQELPSILDDLDLACEDSSQRKRFQLYLEGNYLLKGYCYLHPVQENILYNEVNFTLKGAGLYIRQGFHFETQSIPVDLEDAYWSCFPYAPKARLRIEPYYVKRITYAGSFSIALYAYAPLFDYYSHYWPEGMTGEKNVSLFREHSSYYKLLKPAMEKIFQTPIGLFTGVIY